MTTSGNFPGTVDAAVRLLMEMVPVAERTRIAAMTRDDLLSLHFGLGMWIRNNLGLWEGNHLLHEACGGLSPDDASAVVIEAFWQHLRGLEPRLH
jgi:hypothetical protein